VDEYGQPIIHPSHPLQPPPAPRPGYPATRSRTTGLRRTYTGMQDIDSIDRAPKRRKKRSTPSTRTGRRRALKLPVHTSTIHATILLLQHSYGYRWDTSTIYATPPKRTFPPIQQLRHDIDAIQGRIKIIDSHFLHSLDPRLRFN
jgi:hypothetical protein